MRLVPALLLAATIVLGLAPASRADGLDADAAAAIRTVIENQMAAFRVDDGAAAFAYASPGIQAQFGTSEIFMSMVRSGYQPVYRPRSVTFGEIVDSAAGPLQRVFLTGPDGRGWVAIYALQRQPDGTWRINGCTLVEDESPSI